MNRRQFVKAGAAAVAASSAASPFGISSAWQGANDRIRVGVVGIRGMGQSHIAEYNKVPGVEVAALCDIDENLFPEIVGKHFTSKSLRAPRLFTDLRKLYDYRGIDAVAVVTPNHWHALAGLWAIQAGKHVTIEKPVCHNFFEGKKLVEAAARYKVIVQEGCEQRSNPCSKTAMEFIRSGGLGDVYMAKGLCFKWRDTIGRFNDEPVPAGVHYDLWLGPAPSRPFNRNRFHYNWHWNWDHGNGDIGNQGVHEMDIARWGLGVALPNRVTTVGGHFLFKDDQQTPNMLMAIFEFDQPGGTKKILQFEVRGWTTNREGGLGEIASPAAPGGYMISDLNTIGNFFYGSKGYMVKEVERWQTFFGQKREPGPTGGGLGDHYRNFIDAIRANDQKVINGSVLEGHHTAALIHLANISYRLGRPLRFDPTTEKIVGDDEANRMLTRPYRAPFIVPDKV